MKKHIVLVVFYAALSVMGADNSLVNLAHPLQGTDSRDGFSHGNTYARPRILA